MPNTLSSAQAPPDKAGELAAQVQDFFNYTPSWASAHYGNQLVVYDTTALANSPSDLKSISFDFSDGSTLSLVGLPAALPHQFVA
jgi:hypothetical protein